jgi:serpin B
MGYLAGTLACLMMLACSADATSETDLAPELVGGNTAFGIELFSVLAGEEPDGNLFVSPYSISTALAMTWAGAEGRTAEQMAEVLHFDLPEGTVHQLFESIQSKLQTDYRRQYMQGEGDPLTLEVANALWAQESFPLLQDYVSLVRQSYDAEARNLDFVNNPEGARQTINAWVEDKTRDRIRDLLPRGSIDSMTRLVITNAVYFKGSWNDPFEEAATSDGEFTLADGSTVEVPMMHQTEEYPYAETHGCRAVELPYADNQSSMIVLLPDGDIGDFEQSLTGEKLSDILTGLRSAEIQLSMPSFEFTSSFSLSDVLKTMGMSRAFDPSMADFSGMTGSRDLYISAVIHKAFVKVDEEGTEAAAATAVVMALTSAQPEPEPIVLDLDRPFLFLIRDRITGSVLFMGRVADPSA